MPWNRDNNTTILSPEEFVEASERGRLYAAASITMNSDARYRVEQTYGKEYCKNRWPEAYGKPQTGGFMRAFKDAVQAAKTLIPIVLISVLVLGLTNMCLAQEVQKPRVYAGAGLYVKNTAGYIYNGGHRVAIAASGGTGATAGTLLADTQTSCAAPGFSACNFLIANSSGTVSATQTLATAATPGNTLLAMVETTGGAITRLAAASQSDTIALQALGQTSTFSSAPLPTAAGTIDIGSTTLPFQYIWMSGGSGTPATNQFKLAGTSTSGVRTITFPDATTTLVGLDTAGALSGGKTFTQSVTPTTATTYDIGSATLPFRYLYFWGASGTPGTNNFQITGTSTSGTRAITFPDASITVSGATGTWCGTTNTCSATDKSPILKVVAGTSAALNGGSPAIATIASMPAFSGTSTYVCTVTAQGTGAPTAAFVVSNVSATSFTITGANSSTAVVNYVCVGY